MKKAFNICNFYLIVWVLYGFHWQEAVIPGITRFSNVFLAINLSISLYCWIKVLLSRKLTPCLRGCNYLLVMFIVYGLIRLVSGDNYIISGHEDSINPGSYIIGPLRTLLPIFAFYYFSQKGWLSEASLRYWVFVFLVTNYIIYTHRLIYLNNVETTNNLGYWFLYLLPYVFLFNSHKIIKYLMMAVLSLFVIISVKRGAILLMAIILAFIMWDDLIVSKKNKWRALSFLLPIIFILVGAYFLRNTIETNALFEDRLQQTQEGSMSGREFLWANIINTWVYDSSLLQMLIGRGGDGTLLIGPNYAHNDWLEILCNNGLFGLVVFIAFWISNIREIRRMERHALSYNIMLSVFLICFGQSLFSMFYSATPSHITAILGYALFNSSERVARLKVNYNHWA